MSASIVSFVALAATLSSADPGFLGGDITDPPGSVLPTPTTFPALQPSNTSQAKGNGKFQWQIYGACNENYKNIVTQAWEDSQQFANAFAKWEPNGKYQEAVNMYMGNRSTYSDFRGFDFPRQIQDTISRMQGLYDQKSTYGNANLWVYCNEDSFWFKHCTYSPTTSAIIAYDDEDLFFNNWYITFCPQFFDNLWEASLSEKIALIKRNGQNPQIMETVNSSPGIQAAVFLHESFHMSQIVTSPGAVDYAYGAENVYKLADSRNTDAAVYNADSWKMTAEAIWAQDYFNLNGPPVPRAHYSGSTVEASLNDTLAIDVMYVNLGPVVPQGASPVPAEQAYYVDPSIWQVYTPGKGLAPLSVALPRIPAISDSTSPASTLPASTAPASSVPAPVQASPPPAADQCGDKYEFFFDSFKIYGKYFNSAAFGTDGSGLQKRIKGCGDLTEWHFEPLMNDPNGYQWLASGHLPIGTKACVGRAVVSAGGASPDGCTGSG